MIKCQTKTHLEISTTGSKKKSGSEWRKRLSPDTTYLPFSPYLQLAMRNVFQWDEVLKMAPSTAASPPLPPLKNHPTFCLWSFFSWAIIFFKIRHTINSNVLRGEEGEGNAAGGQNIIIAPQPSSVYDNACTLADNNVTYTKQYTMLISEMIHLL